ncbi:MAG: virulence factor [Acidimicrobiales bacterium]
MPREGGGRRSRGGNEVVVIMWRDIPAQINGKQGDERHQVMLPHRFQKAIDRAAMVAGKKTAQDYIGEWRRTEHPLAGDLVSSVDEIAESIEREFTNERLHVLVANGGWDPASPEAPTDTAPATSSDPEGPAS